MSPVLMSFIAGLITWGVTAAGAALVFLFKDIKPKVLNSMLGFASGVMLAAAFWSLLLPSLELSTERGMGDRAFIPVIVGFALGGLFILVADKLLPHVHSLEDSPKGLVGDVDTMRRSILLVVAITMHNIPEGLAYGVAFGAIGRADSFAEASGAIVLVVGIALQNFPEGAAVSIPLRRDGHSRKKAFFYGQASGIVEPIAAVIGALLSTQVEALLPYALSFAAGAMVYVVVSELLPESQEDSHLYGHAATSGAMMGFMLMTFLDLYLG